ncbi:MAG: N-6 DNA methylase [Gemmatimonadota bacterium]
MTITAATLAQRLWNAYTLVQEDELSRTEYLEALAPLLVLKLDHERTEAPWRQTAVIPRAFDWMTLLAREGDELLVQYAEAMYALSSQPGLPGVIFRGARAHIRHHVNFRKLIVEVVDRERWMAAPGEARAEAWETLIDRTALEPRSPLAGHLTPSVLCHAIIAAVRPGRGDSLCDPLCGTGNFLAAMVDYSQLATVAREPTLQQPPVAAILGLETSASTARIAALALHFRGVQETDSVSIEVGALSGDAERRFDLVCVSAPLSRRAALDAGARPTAAEIIARARALLASGGRAAVIVPDTFLTEGGPGELLRRDLLESGSLHTVLRLAPGALAQTGVLANVLFFDGTGMADGDVWFYDLRTGVHLDPRAHPLRRSHLDEFCACFSGSNRSERTETWSAENPTGRWRKFRGTDLARRNGAGLNVCWLDEETLGDGGAGISADALAALIVQDLKSALAQFEELRLDLGAEDGSSG